MDMLIRWKLLQIRAAVSAALMALLLVSAGAFAAGQDEPAAEEEGEAVEGEPGGDEIPGGPATVGPGGIAPEIGYYNMTPDFITNLAGTGDTGRFSYIRLKVAIMVLDDKDLPALSRYDALIRDEILNVISSKNIATASSASGRESIRAECREHIALLLEDRLGHSVVQDLLFLSYMYM